MATHSSVLAWKIPWTEEPGGLQSMELQRFGQDLVYMCVCARAHTHTHTHTHKTIFISYIYNLIHAISIIYSLFLSYIVSIFDDYFDWDKGCPDS